MSSFSKSVSLFLFCKELCLYHFFLDSIYKGCHTILLFVCLTSLTMTILMSTHVAADGIISVFLMASQSVYFEFPSVQWQPNRAAQLSKPRRKAAAYLLVLGSCELLNWKVNSDFRDAVCRDLKSTHFGWWGQLKPMKLEFVKRNTTSYDELSDYQVSDQWVIL